MRSSVFLLTLYYPTDFLNIGAQHHWIRWYIIPFWRYNLHPVYRRHFWLAEPVYIGLYSPAISDNVGNVATVSWNGQKLPLKFHWYLIPFRKCNILPVIVSILTSGSPWNVGQCRQCCHWVWNYCRCVLPFEFSPFQSFSALPIDYDCQKHCTIGVT